MEENLLKELLGQIQTLENKVDDLSFTNKEILKKLDALLNANKSKGLHVKGEFLIIQGNKKMTVSKEEIVSFWQNRTDTTLILDVINKRAWYKPYALVARLTFTEIAVLNYFMHNPCISFSAVALARAINCYSDLPENAVAQQVSHIRRKLRLREGNDWMLIKTVERGKYYFDLDKDYAILDRLSSDKE